MYILVSYLLVNSGLARILTWMSGSGVYSPENQLEFQFSTQCKNQMRSKILAVEAHEAATVPLLNFLDYCLVQILSDSDSHESFTNSESTFID